MSKQLLLFDIKPVGEAYKPYPFDLNNSEHIAQAIAWQKKHSYPLFEIDGQLEWIPVFDWEYEASYEVNYEMFSDFDDAYEVFTELEEENGWVTEETTLEIKINKRIIHKFEYNELYELTSKQFVLDHLYEFSEEFKFQGELYQSRYNAKLKRYELHKTRTNETK